MPNKILATGTLTVDHDTTFKMATSTRKKNKAMIRRLIIKQANIYGCVTVKLVKDSGRFAIGGCYAVDYKIFSRNTPINKDWFRYAS